ncbi:MAG: hypothetical protein QG622_1520 [Actinomycetota bacterium]|nr:hypothetical protein [Actinomycetota bacterium]
MSDSVQMPALGESVSEGTVTRWLKQVGDRVEVDEPLLEVSTDKVDTEIPSPVAGVLQEILVGEDETVAVGADLAVIGTGVDSGPASPAPGSALRAAEPAPEPSPRPAQAAPAPSPVAAGPVAPGPVAAPGPAAVAPGSAAAPSVGDAGRVQMPALGESVSEGTVTRWLKQVGDRVEVDEPLLEVSTDKVDTEIPSPVAGVLQEILVGEDETVAVGADLAVVASGAASPAAPEPVPAPRPVTPTPAPAPAPAAAQAPSPPPAPAVAASAAPATVPAVVPAPENGGGSGSGQGGNRPQPSRGISPVDLSVYVTPLVRKLAVENGVDLSSVSGTGVGGRIRKKDVLDAAEALRAAQAAEEALRATASAPSSRPEAPQVSSLRGTTVPMSRLRKVIAKRMVESLQTSAQLTTVVEVDVTRVARLRSRAKAEFEAREGVKLSFLPFFALAAVEALKQYPMVNASIEGESIVYHASENLGVAVDTERGLLVPVIRDAGDLNIAGLARRIADLADRTRKNKVTPDELGGGTFTLTNTGSRGALFDTPIINQPQVAILGTGAIVRRAVVVQDEGGDAIAIRSMVYLALSYDHRIVDGADAARFLASVKQRLEEGRFEAALGVTNR